VDPADAGLGQSAKIRPMPRKPFIAAVVALVVVFAFLIPCAASSPGNGCTFGPCKPSTLIK